MNQSPQNTPPVALREAVALIGRNHAHLKDVARLLPPNEPLCLLVLQCQEDGCDHFRAGTVADMLRVAEHFAHGCIDLPAMAARLATIDGSKMFLISHRHECVYAESVVIDMTSLPPGAPHVAFITRTTPPQAAN